MEFTNRDRLLLARAVINRLHPSRDGGLQLDEKRPFGNSGYRVIALDIAAIIESNVYDDLESPDTSAIDDAMHDLLMQTPEFIRKECKLVLDVL